MKTTSKTLTTKASESLSYLVSCASLLTADNKCILFFYEPKQPEGLNNMNIKELLPKRKAHRN